MKKIVQFLYLLALVLSTGCASHSDNGKFPTPTAGFVPKHTYAIPFDKLWSGIVDALDQNRITTVSMDKATGIIATDYIAGPGSFSILMAQSTRYKYSITARSQADGTVRVNVICKLESSINGGAGSSQWRDVSPQNAVLVARLETWLYEQLEQAWK